MKIEQLKEVAEYATAKGGVYLHLDSFGLEIEARHPIAPRAKRFTRVIPWIDLVAIIDEAVVPILQSKIDDCWHGVREVKLPHEHRNERAFPYD